MHILLVSKSSLRRLRLSELVRRTFKTATIKAVSGISHASLQESGAEILVADVETPSAAAEMVRVVKETPGRVGMVALIDDPDPRWIQAALEAGIHAIISATPDAEELRLALAAAEAGMILLHPSSAHYLADHRSRPSNSNMEIEPLTSRESQVLRLISEGLGNKEIAARLEISEHTAKFHISSILGKLGVASRTEAVSEGIRKGLIPI